MDAQQQRMVIPYQPPDYTSALALTETRSITDAIFHDFCGIIRKKLKDGTYEYKRVAVPRMTYDHANEILNGVYSLINRITARTSFSDLDIRRYCLLNGETLMMSLATKGFHNLISDAAWEYCMEMANPLVYKDQDGKIKKDDNGDEIRTNLWEQEYNMKWSYDDPITITHLNIVKRKYGLEDEGFGQKTILSKIMWEVITFIHSGLNRSKDALTLDHEKIIHKEQSIVQTGESNKPSESMIDKAKEGFKKMLGVR